MKVISRRRPDWLLLVQPSLREGVIGSSDRCVVRASSDGEGCKGVIDLLYPCQIGVTTKSEVHDTRRLCG